MSTYNFNLTLHPYGLAAGAGVVQIDEWKRYGYWEYRDGTEGGGLWFDRDDTGALELVDFDGAGQLPFAVVKHLRDAGFVVDDTF